MLADPDTTIATQGDMRGEDVNAFGAEFNAMINNCDTAYNNLGRAGIGITAVNAGLFHDAAGNYIGVIGWGGCAEIGGNCAVPFDGRVALIDNRYLHPASPDRTFPPSPGDPAGNLQFTITDPLDVLAGHEFGHALSLDHRNNTLALMNPGVTDNSGDGTADNVQLNNAEVTALRNNALNVPGLETDPQGLFNPGRFVVNRQPDTVQENPDFPAHLDLASVRAAIDTQENQVYLEQQLFGLLPAEGEPVRFVYLLDVDGPEAGMTQDQLRQLEMPADIDTRGVDMIAIATVRGGQTFGNVAIVRDGEIIVLDGRFTFSLLTMVLHPQFAPLSGEGGVLPEDREYAVHHIIQLNLTNEVLGIALDRPFRLQTLIVTGEQGIADRLDDDPAGRAFVLEQPSFPHCRALADGVQGQPADVEFDGLTPNSSIHALLGPLMVATGTANEDGGGVIQMPIPADAAPGYHLITIGVDGTALTADCIIFVREADGDDGDGDGDGDIPRDEFALLTSHEDLLRRQARLLELLGLLIRALSQNDQVPVEVVQHLVDGYGSLLGGYNELLKDFADLVRQAVDD
ncbi:MAG: hypothetical protein IPK19_38735 [Chloroflexi bacterium]|nr:hypothetical protein [Chloroflexota bacterium]